MDQNGNGRIWINRILAFIVGGLLTLAVVSLAVVAPVKTENVTLTEQLDEIQNGAARLLSEAVVYAQIESYDKAKKTLNTLFEKHPASAEAGEGAILYAGIETTIKESDQKWEAAVAMVRTEWEKTTSSELREKFERDRLLMETNLTVTLEKEWEKAKASIRQEWEEL